MEEKYNYQTKETFEPTKNLQTDLYQIIKLELGYYLSDKYEDSMDRGAEATSLTEMNYWENYCESIRHIKTAFKDKRIDNLQSYSNSKRDGLKDRFLQPKELKQLSVALELIEKVNNSVLQLIYNISEEVKEGSLKKITDCYDLIDTYFSKKFSKKYDSFGDFVNGCYEYIDKSLNLAYGGYNYGKK